MKKKKKKKKNILYTFFTYKINKEYRKASSR